MIRPRSRERTPKSPWILLVVALAAGAGLAFLWRASTQRDGAFWLQSARTRFASRDLTGALREAELAVARATAESRTELLKEALGFRAELLADRTNFDAALADLGQVLELDPENDETELRIAEVEIRAKRFADAAARCSRVLERDSGNPVAWSTLGQARQLEAEAELTETRAEIARFLAGTQAARAEALLSEIASRDRGDLRRTGRLLELARLFEDARVPVAAEKTEALLERASELLAGSRRAYAEALRNWANQQSIQGFLEILSRSGRTALVADFGWAALAHESALTSTEAVQAIARGLRDEGRPLVAIAVVEQALLKKVHLEPEFLVEYCRVLYDAEHWQQLRGAASGLRGRILAPEEGPFFRRAADLYLGLALAPLGLNDDAIQALERFGVSAAEPPFPEAPALAAFTLAEAARAKGQPDQEYAALRTALALAPDLRPASWLRLAEVGAVTHAPPNELERALSNSLRLFPERTRELLPRWSDAGTLALRQAGIDLVLTRDWLLGSGRSYSETPSCAYELYALAQMHLDTGFWTPAIDTARALLRLQPGFVPALDILIACYEQLGDEERLAEVLVDHLEHGGPDEKLLQRIHELPPELLSGSDTVRLMRCDPGNTGLAVLTRDLPDAESRRLAMQALLRGGAERLGLDGRLLGARLLVELDLWGKALELLQDFPSDSPAYTAVLRLKIEAAVALREDALLQRTLIEVARAQVLDKAELLPVVDELLRRGRSEAAGLLLARLDRAPETRGADVMLRQAVAGLVGGSAQGAREALDRAEAYTEDGTAEIGRILLAIEQRSWTELPEAVRELRSVGYTPTTFQDALLTALEERLPEAYGLAGVGREEFPWDPLWSLLEATIASLADQPPLLPAAFGVNGVPETVRLVRGGSGTARDPRDVLALLLALDSGPFAAFALVELASAEAGALWPLYLQAEGLQRLGEDALAVRFLELSTRTWPDFAPAWDRLLEIEEARLGTSDAPELIELRAARRKALGETEDAGAELLFADGLRRLREGDFGGAFGRAGAALSTDPGLVPAQLLRARASVALGDLAGAVADYRDYCALAEPERASAVLSEAIETLHQARRRDLVSEAVQSAGLTALALRFPDAPFVILAQARSDLTALPDDPTAGLARAYTRLDTFRAKNPGVSMNTLAAGASRAWAELLMEADPLRAETFVREELELAPGSLDHWILLGEALAGQGRFEEALAQLSIVVDMVPNARALRQMAAIQGRLGARHAEVRNLLARVRVNDPATQADPELDLIEALSLVNSGPAALDIGIQTLERLWMQRSTFTRALARDVSLRYGYSLVQRARFADRELAEQVLAEAATLVTDPAEEDLVLAMRHMALQIPEPKPEPEAKEVAEGAPAPTPPAVPGEPPGS